MTATTTRGADSIPAELRTLHDLRALAPAEGVWTAAYGPLHLFRLPGGAASVVDTAARERRGPLDDATLQEWYPGFFDGTAWTTLPDRRRKRPAEGAARAPLEDTDADAENGAVGQRAERSRAFTGRAHAAPGGGGRSRPRAQQRP